MAASNLLLQVAQSAGQPAEVDTNLVTYRLRCRILLRVAHAEHPHLPVEVHIRETQTTASARNFCAHRRGTCRDTSAIVITQLYRRICFCFNFFSCLYFTHLTLVTSICSAQSEQTKLTTTTPTPNQILTDSHFLAL